MFKKITEKVIFNGKIKTLEHFDMLRLLSDEKVLLIQREHWIVLVVPALINILMLVVLFALVCFVFLYANLLPFQLTPFVFLYLFLLIISFLGVMAHYIFMQWYYQYYIITNKRIAHIHFFRVGGFFFEELFFSRLKEKEVKRSASNFIYDLFNIHDVIVAYDAFEKDTGFTFVFKTPANAEQIEALLGEIINKKREI